MGRPGQERRADRPVAPELAEWISGSELPKDIHAELRALSKDNADTVAKHLVAALALTEEGEIEEAYSHAAYAVTRGARVGAVREIYGVLAYEMAEYKIASRELRTAQRLTGRYDHMHLIADSERGLGRPEKALELGASQEAVSLSGTAAVELAIVLAGAHADQGNVAKALETLEIPALKAKVDGAWQVRLWVAYSDMLSAAGRDEEARKWLTLAADVDKDRITDAADRLGRPAPAPQPEPSWIDGEQISVIDALAEDDEDDPDASQDDSIEPQVGDEESSSEEASSSEETLYENASDEDASDTEGLPAESSDAADNVDSAPAGTESTQE